MSELADSGWTAANDLTEVGLLRVWEQGLTQPSARRAVSLAMVAVGDRLDSAAAAELPIGQRNLLLLGLRERCFGSTLPCAVSCPRCEEGLDVTVTAGELRAAVENADLVGESSLRIDGHELTVRALTSADLLTVDPADPKARTELLSRCVLDRTDEPLPDWVLDAVAAKLAELDPGADVRISLDCPECGHTWEAAFDIADHVWAEIEAYAKRLVHEVYVLATAFGWTEADVLAVSPTRRRMYLEATAV